jgi:hypothetical protein
MIPRSGSAFRGVFPELLLPADDLSGDQVLRSLLFHQFPWLQSQPALDTLRQNNFRPSIFSPSPATLYRNNLLFRWRSPPSSRYSPPEDSHTRHLPAEGSCSSCAAPTRPGEASRLSAFHPLTRRKASAAAGLCSTSRRGNIVTRPRSDVMYVVTEYGMVNPEGKACLRATQSAYRTCAPPLPPGPRAPSLRTPLKFPAGCRSRKQTVCRHAPLAAAASASRGLTRQTSFCGRQAESQADEMSSCVSLGVIIVSSWFGVKLRLFIAPA